MTVSLSKLAKIHCSALMALIVMSCLDVIKAAEAIAPPRDGLTFASFGPLNTDIFIADADGSNARPIIANPALDSNASFSADGDWILFTSTRNGSSDIYRARLDGKGVEQLTHNPSFDDQGALSPDGRHLAFVSSREGQADIWVVDLKTKKLRNLTRHPGGDFRPAWSPDGQWIAFSSDRLSTKKKHSFVTLHSTELFVVRTDGTQLRQVTSQDAFAGSPVWSLDGQSLIYYEASLEDVQKITSPRRLRGTTQIVSITLATGERNQLTDGPGEKWSPHALPDKRIAYTSGGPEGGIDFIGNATGARGEMRNPYWSVDGKSMVFQRETSTVWPPWQTLASRTPEICLIRTGIFASASPDAKQILLNDQTAGALHNGILVMNMDGSNRTLLFGDAKLSALAPVWSADGEQIAFGFGGFFQSVTGSAIADIAVMRADGTGLRILTDGSGNYGFPSWSADANQIVYRSAGKDKNGLSILDVKTQVTRELTRGGHENFPSWSPDGNSIAFTSDRDGDYDIYIIKPDGSDLKRLTQSPGNDAHNVWSPDGQWIAFTSSRGGFKDEAALHPYNPQPYGDLYIMRKDGSDIRQMTDDQFEDGTPGWFKIPDTGSKPQTSSSCTL
ncbi:PD40 domain-containing protein [Asticcacaulis endophyticus]|nr:PD40 domain-containing protein [Asticcacaulis endophyticus]